MAKYISCNYKCKFNSTTCNSSHKLNNEKCQYEWKKYSVCKKNYSWNPGTCICENDKYLKSIVDTSVITCDPIICVMDIVSTKMTSTIAANVSINLTVKKVRYKTDCYTLHTVLLVIDKYYYSLSLCKT